MFEKSDCIRSERSLGVIVWDMHVELRHLRALDAIAEEGTFGRAADRLGYTQSTVSQQIAALERTVGGSLFDRPGGPRAGQVDAARLSWYFSAGVGCCPTRTSSPMPSSGSGRGVAASTSAPSRASRPSSFPRSSAGCARSTRTAKSGCPRRSRSIPG